MSRHADGDPPPTAALAARDSGLERLIDRFEDAWHSGPRPVLDDFLPAASADRPAALVELVHTDLEYRLKHGEAARVEEYLARYPELADHPPTVLNLIAAEWQYRRRREADLGWQEYQTRFPGLATAHPPAAPCGPSPPLGAESALTGGPLAGTRLGKYELLEVAGRGAMSVVYRARDTELEREVAVKLPRLGGLLTADEADRFLREARSAAQLRHPGIVPVHDAGRFHDLCYVVSAFVRGPTLADQLQAGRLPTRAAVALLADVADALEHAHRHGVIHRDLKPANLLLDESGRPLVMDFGLARREAGEPTLTEEGQILGTPAYMAPEQARGEAHRVDARADIYSLGVILYELLTGEVPFQGHPRMVLRQVIEDEPRPPRRLDDTVPRELEAICLKALTKEPAGRYATAADLAADLRAFLDGRPVCARPLGPGRRLWRRCRRNPVVAGLLASLLTALVGGLVGVTALWWLAETERQQARVNLAKAQAAIRQQLTRVSESRLVHVPRLTRVRRELLHEAVTLYQDLLKDYPRERTLRLDAARAYFLQARLCAQIGAAAQAETDYHQAIALLTELCAEQPDDPAPQRDRVTCWHGLAQHLEQAGRFAEAEATYAQALAERERLLETWPSPEHRRDLAATLNNLGLFRQNRNQREGAEAAHRRALEIYQQLTEEFPAEPPNLMGLAATQQNLGTLFTNTGRTRAAETALRQSLDLRTALAARHPEEPDYRQGQVHSLLNLSVLLQQTKRLPEADATLAEAVDLGTRLVAEFPDLPGYRFELASAHNNRGSLLSQTKQFDAAAEAFRQAQTLGERLVADEPHRADYRSQLGTTLNNSARLQLRRDNSNLACQLLEKAVGQQRSAWEINPRHPQYRLALRISLAGWGDLLIRLERYAEAAPVVEEFAHLCAESGQDCFLAATALARCASKALADRTLPEEQRPVLAQAYGDRCLALLRQAIAGGYTNPAHYQTSKDLDVVRDRPEFQRLLHAMPVGTPP